ncbi:MAG: helix-turn-helix domain-containing protein, partial [Longimicrobiales bacterium]
NVREMQNAVERAVILCTTREVPRELFPLEDADAPAPTAGRAATAGPTPSENGSGPAHEGALADDPAASLEDLERRHIARVLENSETLEAAADTLGIAPSTLWRKRRKYDL